MNCGQIDNRRAKYQSNMPPGQYVLVPRSLLDDENLSFGAKGLMIFLISQGEGHPFSAKDLYKESPSLPTDTDSYLEELQHWGYIVNK